MVVVYSIKTKFHEKYVYLKSNPNHLYRNYNYVDANLLQYIFEQDPTKAM